LNDPEPVAGIIVALNISGCPASRVLHPVEQLYCLAADLNDLGKFHSVLSFAVLRGDLLAVQELCRLGSVAGMNFLFKLHNIIHAEGRTLELTWRARSVSVSHAFFLPSSSAIC